MFFDKRSGRSATKETLATAGTQESRAEIKVVERTDTVYVEKRDSVYVQGTLRQAQGDKVSPVTSALKWIFWIIFGLAALIITAKLCLHR